MQSANSETETKILTHRPSGTPAEKNSLMTCGMPSSFFRGVDGCLILESGEEFNAEAQRAQRKSVIVGCDIAKHTDWTVCIAIDAKTGLCLEIERFNQLDWPVQRERIAAFVKRW